MKTVQLFLCLIILPNLLFSQRIDSAFLTSKAYNSDRKIYIYTPKEYDTRPDAKFEVIYVFDSQLRRYFDVVHSTLGFINNDQFPMIVVGIVSDNRNKEFLPKNEHPETLKKYKDNQGGADNFLSFIKDELVPHIDENYRTYPKRIAIGHSNGGTFISYCLFKNPELFDAYIEVSPNFSYDEGQVVKKLSTLDANKLTSQKFIYMCNANETDKWMSAKKDAYSLLKSKPFKDKITVVDQDFSKLYNHMSVFPIGVYNGLKNYLDFQFFDVNNLITYYTALYNQKLINLTPEILKELSQYFLLTKGIDDAAKVLLWAAQLFPDELHLYITMGEMYQNSNKYADAIKYYQVFKDRLESKKASYSNEEFNNLKTNIEMRIQHLENKE